MKKQKLKLIILSGITILFSSFLFYGGLVGSAVVAGGCNPGSSTTTTPPPMPVSKPEASTLNLVPGNPPTTDPCLVYSFILGGPSRPTGNLTGIKNVTPNSLIVLSGTSQITLGPSGSPTESATAAQITTLYGSPTPMLPISLNVCGSGAFTYLYVTYNCTNCP